MLQGSQELLGPRRTELGVLDRRQPSGEADRERTAHHEARALAQRLLNRRALSRHLHPRAPATR